MKPAPPEGWEVMDVIKSPEGGRRERGKNNKWRQLILRLKADLHGHVTYGIFNNG